MKKYALIILVAVMSSCEQQEMAPSEDVKETLKTFVEGETYAYMEKDYAKWESYWDHSNEVLRIDVADSGFAQVRGWEKSGGKLESFFKENPDPITSTFENSNYLIFYDVNLAWVAFDQTWTTKEGEESVAKATITLIKKGKGWKMISYTAIQYEADDENVDTLGRE